MQKIEITSNHQIWFDENLIQSPDKGIFEIEFWQGQGKVLGSATGRGTTWFIQTDILPGALRHYRRGGLFGKLVNDCYLFSGWKKTRSYQEFRLLNHLIAENVNVPRPIAAQAIKIGCFYRADLISEKITDAQDLVAILTKQPLSSAVYVKIGEEIAKMHRAGVDHTDLNIHNIMIDVDERVWIIDFDKCRYQAGQGWQKNNLARLKRSFCKEQKKRQIDWQEHDFSALLQGYYQNTQ
ncbi:3-deoxy-D-manno-octulosonic acid kinase [Vibrio scophthalmi]|uniref:3-deoxy-D-manno-octulosonic acid kinase n=1 Tax=Vibrio scophthalmi TaxID=45658 RepID=UPI0008096F9F|nr:3-deoxy-D-manno-octulosonic acid kinase [Vibrio scophthalmi]ANS84156.1 3-deoxy-D-manno-octulosonic acid kinase [Vibrio scophthalmi]